MTEIAIARRGAGQVLAAAVFTLVALFGTAVRGSGGSRAAAMDDADTRARRIAAERGTCITPAKLEECTRESDGTWICTAYVANHQGSCSR
jgi:hypothetical protein